MKFKHTSLLLFLLLSLSYCSSYAQQITARIIDQSTNEPVPFATIQYAENKGTISNTEGYFNVTFNNSNQQNTLIISYMGYETETVTIKALEANNYIIKLKEATNALNEVYITNKAVNADSIMFKVQENLTKNYNHTNVKYQIFSRSTSFFKTNTADLKLKKSTGYKKSQLKTQNKELVKLGEKLANTPPTPSYTDVLMDYYVINDSLKKLNITQATNLLDKNAAGSVDAVQEESYNVILTHLDTTKTFKIKTGIFKVEDSLSFNDEKDNKEDKSVEYLKNSTNSFLKKYNFNKSLIFNAITDNSLYEYSINDITYIEGKLVYIIDYQPKKNKAKFEGKLYISDDDYAILKFTHKFAEGKVGNKLNLKFLLGIKYEETTNTGTVIYKKNEDTNFYYPYYINNETNSYFYMNRPIKFIENSEEKNKIAFNFKIEGATSLINEFMILSSTKLNQNQFDAAAESKTVDYKQLNKYDASIWKNYNVLEPIETMKAFEVKTQND